MVNSTALIAMNTIKKRTSINLKRNKEITKTHYWVYYIIRNAGGNGLQPCLGTLRSQSGKFVFAQEMLEDFKNVVSFSVIEVDKGSYDRVDMLVNEINKQTKDEDIHINTDNRTGH